MVASEAYTRRSPLRFMSQPAGAVAALAVVSVLVIIMAVWALLWELKWRDQAQALRETQSLARILMQQVAQSIASPDLALRGVADRLQTSFGAALPLDSEPVHLLLGARAHGMPQIKAIFLVDPQGQVVNSSTALPGRALQVADSDYFRALAGGAPGLYVSRAEHCLLDGAWTLHLARRIDGPDGRLRAIAVASLNLSAFEQQFGSFGPEVARPIALYLADGTLLASLPVRRGEYGDRSRELVGVGLPQLDDQLETVTRTRREGATQHFAIGRVSGYPLLVGVTNDDVETLASWRETAVMITLSAFAVVLLVAGAALALTSLLQRDERLSRALREADARFEQTVETVMDAIVSVDETQRIVIFNRAAERMFGRRAQEVIGQPLSLLVPPAVKHVHEHHITGFMTDPRDARAMGAHLTIRGKRADGSDFPLASTISKTRIRGQVQMTAILRDITDQVRAEEELQTLNQELRRLAVSQQSVREEERERISRELHDELGQQLTGIKLDLSWMTLRQRGGRALDPGMLDRMGEMLDAAIVSVRRISSELRPRILDELGFGEAVLWQSNEFARRSGLEISTDLRGAGLVHDRNLATALFRIVQESLTNVARHAAARRVHIVLTSDDDGLLLQVDDDGIGYSPDRGAHVGLLSMRERALAFGGRFSIGALPAGGTRVEVHIPFIEQDMPQVEEA